MVATIDKDMVTTTDKLAARRRRRDRVASAHERLLVVHGYAKDRAAYYLARAKADTSLPEDVQVWLQRVENAVGMNAIGSLNAISIPDPPVYYVTLVAENADCSAAQKWAGQVYRCRVLEPDIKGRLDRYQKYLTGDDSPTTTEELEELDDESADREFERAHREWLDSGGSGPDRCGEPTVGHGRAPYPCKNRLGSDGVCQDHG